MNIYKENMLHNGNMYPGCKTAFGIKQILLTCIIKGHKIMVSNNAPCKLESTT